MRLFGILLIPLILIAGGAYVYFGLQDWKGRQQINAAGFRHLLVLQGLPLEGDDFAPDDETPFVSNMAGGEQTRTVSKKLLTGYFADNTKTPAAPAAAATPGVDAPVVARAALASSDPVVSQAAEVKRVLALLKAELGKAPEPTQKVPLVMGWLLLQAETMNERLLFQGLAATTDADGKAKTAEQIAADAEQLVHLLDRKFYRVAPKLYDSEAGPLSPAKWTEMKQKIDAAGEAGAALKPPVSTDEADRRDKIAHLLAHLDQDKAWQQRVAVVVGLRRYAYALATQATRFREMRDHVDLPVSADQATFQLRHDLLMNEARQNVDRARTVAGERAKLVEQKTDADDSVSRRRTQLKELTAQLEKVKADVDRQLVLQSGIEKQLYEIQREVALTLEEVYRLEALLVDAERERYGALPKPRP